MKKKQVKKKKRKQVRTRNWAEAHETSFTHDRIRHRRAQAAISDVALELQSLPTDFEPNALLISHSKKWAFVLKDGAEELCLIDERLKEGRTSLLAPGDKVYVEREAEKWMVRGVAPRRTRLSRPGHEHDKLDEQVFAANIDLLVIVTAAANPPFRPGLVDRYLIAAEVGGVDTVICVNKMDLVDEAPPELQDYETLGFRVIRTSCETGAGLDELRGLLGGKLSVLSGHSGVGKSSLLNALDPDLAVHTQEVSDVSQRGRHTTTASRLYELDGGIRIIDTPGIRALGVWGVSPAEVGWFFPDLAALGVDCRFRDCSHTHEPDCAVTAAVEAGELTPWRYESYLRIRQSMEDEQEGPFGDRYGRKSADY
ncbi:MAG: ribosome small subunit-dependent GTPase A [Candidatus Hydrogenedentes bacterium]|nr:ribosome small subunit-dependent GTPase A [Candidatus Hydrogenedentota bacterium]